MPLSSGSEVNHSKSNPIPTMKTMPFKLACFFLCTSLQLVNLFAQDTSTPKAENLVQFQTDVQPILMSKCLECHCEKEAKGGMRVDQLESLLGYVESGDADASSLWNDYLNTKDPDSIMPPPHGADAGGLSMAERLVFRTWINEGATGQWKAIESNGESKPEAVAIPQTLPGKVVCIPRVVSSSRSTPSHRLNRRFVDICALLILQSRNLRTCCLPLLVDWSPRSRSSVHYRLVLRLA